MNTLQTLLAAGAATLAFSGAVSAQSVCATPEEIEQVLEETRYGETLQMTGDISAVDGLDLDFNLYANEGTGNWVFTTFNGETECLLLGGDSYVEPENEDGLTAYGSLGGGLLFRVFQDSASGNWSIDTSYDLNAPATENLTGTNFQEITVQAPTVRP